MNSEQYCLGRSLNTDWIRNRVKHIPRRKHTNQKNSRASSVASLRTTSADFFAETDDDELNDTIKEFKLTLKLFKRLTQQVHDVNQCINRQRIYSFKHHLNNEGIASPALRRSQLAAAMISNREIPATQAANEPCNDLGPACTYLKRPCSRQERGTRVPFASRPSSSAPASRSSSPALNARPSSRRTSKPISEKTVNLKKTKSDLARDDAEAREALEASDPTFEELFVPEELSLEDLEFRFHDPYPETWVDEVVEDACFRGSKKTDPFMLRLSELESLREETVLWEKYRDEKARQTAETANPKAFTHKNARQVTSMSQSSRTQSAKVAAPPLLRTKTGANKLRRTASAGKSTSSNHVTPASDEGSDSVQTFRNSGYKLGISFLPGSLYPEARPAEKARTTKSENASQNLRAAASPSLQDSKKPAPPPKPPSCGACDARTAVGKKAAGSSARAAALSINALRSQYELKSTECYDIVELARTFDPPCKDQFTRAKRKSTAQRDNAASTKGMTPGKSYFSQRRISLTRLVPDETMTVKGIGARNATRPPIGRCKSAKKGHKRR